MRIDDFVRLRNLTEAMRYPSTLAEIATSDATELIAKANGYAVPLPEAEREEWKRNMALTDKVFHASVVATMNMLIEYANAGIRHVARENKIKGFRRETDKLPDGAKT